jgi:hypothetical protein
MRVFVALIVVGLVAGCAGTPASRTQSAPVEKTAAAESARPSGPIVLHIANVLGTPLKSRVDLLDIEGRPPLHIEVPEGNLDTQAPVGEYRAYVHVYDGGVPVLVKVANLTVAADKPAQLTVSLLEGSSGSLTLRDFDYDGDLAIDNAELEAGTNPEDPTDIPGRAKLPLNMTVLDKSDGWYRGELHAHSRHGAGSETVGQLIRRAEHAGLDFLAITDRNNVDSLRDPEYHSEKLALIPAMEWGNEKKGVALVYGMRTMPDLPTDSIPAAQAECLRVQAQGGLWVAAHPCFPTEPWQWALSYVSGIETWCRAWRGVPPMTLDQLCDELKEKKNERLVQSIAIAAARSELAATSANAQATNFYDIELNHGLMAAAIGGSNSSSPKAPLGRPLTCVYARDKSAPAIIEGIRLGRTYITSGPDGPGIFFAAGVARKEEMQNGKIDLQNGKIDVGIGGVVPVSVDVHFIAAVTHGAGKKLEVLENGRPIRTVPITEDSAGIQFLRKPGIASEYRVRVIGPAPQNGAAMGDVEVYAMTSPIYAREITQDLLRRNPKFDANKAWIKIQANKTPMLDLPEDAAPGTSVRPGGPPAPPQNPGH